MQTMVFDEQVGFQNGYQWSLLAENLEHPKTWQHVEQQIKVDDTRQEPFFVLGSGNDSVNIRTALWLSRKYPEAKILARCFRRATFVDQIAGDCDFEIVGIAELLLTAMRPEWFGRKLDKTGEKASA
jgi:hypothetical protein